MNAFSKIDMDEVTRLTRAGKLAEAMALLHKQRATGESVRPVKASGPPELAQTLQAFRDRLPKLGLLSSVGDSLGRLGPARQSPVPVPEGARFEERTFSNAVGSRTYKVYVPSGYSGQSLPVVIMLHGCTQNPDEFAAGTRMNEVAEEQTFLVAYPRQPQSANMQKCWNWFNAGDQQREGGESHHSHQQASPGKSLRSSPPTRHVSMWRASRPAVQRRRLWRRPILIFLRPLASIRGWPAARPGTCRRPSLPWAGAGRFGRGVMDGRCRPSSSATMLTGLSTLSTATTSSPRQRRGGADQGRDLRRNPTRDGLHPHGPARRRRRGGP